MNKIHLSTQANTRQCITPASSIGLITSNYKLASHNSMTYLKPKKWYWRLLAFTARCQSKSLKEQYEKYGVRMFDLRLKFNKKGEVCFAHGAIEYDCNVISVYSYLNSLPDIVVRVLLENKPGEAEEYFKEECQFLEEFCPNVKWVSGRNKYNWEQVYKFKHEEPSYEDKYSSNNVSEPGKPITGTILDDLYPKIYAQKHNKENRLKGTTKEYLMIDYVEIG